MRKRVAAALVVVVVVVAACAAATARMIALRPFVVVEAQRVAHNDALRFEDWTVVAKARGGEAIEGLSIEVVSGSARIVDAASIPSLAPYDRQTFQVRVTGGGPALVRVRQKSPEATYDVALGAAP